MRYNLDWLLLPLSYLTALSIHTSRSAVLWARVVVTSHTAFSS
jgi:hypothetical protein